MDKDIMCIRLISVRLEIQVHKGVSTCLCIQSRGSSENIKRSRSMSVGRIEARPESESQAIYLIKMIKLYQNWVCLEWRIEIYRCGFDVNPLIHHLRQEKCWICRQTEMPFERIDMMETVNHSMSLLSFHCAIGKGRLVTLTFPRFKFMPDSPSFHNSVQE